MGTKRLIRLSTFASRGGRLGWACLLAIGLVLPRMAPGCACAPCETQATAGCPHCSPVSSALGSCSSGGCCCAASAGKSVVFEGECTPAGCDLALHQGRVPDGSGCPCSVRAPAPVPRVNEQSSQPQVPLAVAPSAYDWDLLRADLQGVNRLPVAEQQPGPPLRVLLCVWRN